MRDANFTVASIHGVGGLKDVEFPKVGWFVLSAGFSCEELRNSDLSIFFDTKTEPLNKKNKPGCNNQPGFNK